MQFTARSRRSYQSVPTEWNLQFVHIGRTRSTVRVCRHDTHCKTIKAPNADALRRAIAFCSADMRMTEEQLQAIERKPGYRVPVPAAARPDGLPQTMPKTSGPRRNKYGNEPVFEDDQRFDSKLELRYYQDLKLRRTAGEVLWFCRQVTFILEGAVKYRCDFVVALAAGGTDVIDCKGNDTQDSINKRKQVKARYGVDVQLWRG